MDDSIDKDNPFESEVEKDEEGDDYQDKEHMLTSVFEMPDSKKAKPSEEGLQQWKRSRKMGEDFNQGDWKTCNMKNFVSRFTMHPEAEPFRAQEPDHNVEMLEWKKEKDLEKQLKLLQSYSGAMGHALTRQLSDYDSMIAGLVVTIKEFQDPEEKMDDPRLEAANVLDGIRRTVFKEWGRDLSEVLKTQAALFNSLLMMRRFELESFQP